VTSRATGDDLIGDEQDEQPSDIMAPPRRSPQKSAAAKSAPAKAVPPDDAASDATPGAGRSANGGPAAGNGTKDASAKGGKDALPNGSAAPAKDAARPAVADATIADGVPALPADTIGAARGTKAKGPHPDRETPASKVSEPSSVDDSPAFSLGAPPFAPVPVADPAESAAKPPVDDVWTPASARTASSGTASSGTGPSGTTSSGTAPSGAGPSGRPSPSVPPAPGDPPSVSPAAFAWEMPDPPPNSPSSPARTFLRSGTTAKNPAAPKAASSGNPAKTEAGKTAARESPVTMRSTEQKKSQSKGQSKRTARQAHLTIARVEPWSVMKFSFVVSLVAFVILFVAVMVLYSVLSGLGVFDSLQRVVTSVTSSQNSAGVNAKAWFSESKVLGYTALLGSLNIVLITAMSTIGSVVYNLTSRLVGGVEVTLRETE
jgi:hypothetical protein